jgi:transposase
MCTVFWNRKGVILQDFPEPGQTIKSDRHIATLTTLKARISKVRPEKTTFLLQHDNARPHTSLKTVEHIVSLCWTVVPHPPYSPDLAPSDFHLFEPMKGLRGQHFLSYDAVVRAVKQGTTSTGADFYELLFIAGGSA